VAPECASAIPQSKNLGVPRRKRSVTLCTSVYVATNSLLIRGAAGKNKGLSISPKMKGWNGTNVLKLRPMFSDVQDRHRTFQRSICRLVERLLTWLVAPAWCCKGRRGSVTSAAPSNHFAVATHNKGPTKETTQAPGSHSQRTPQPLMRDCGGSAQVLGCGQIQTTDTVQTTQLHDSLVRASFSIPESSSAA
jgi:hypothetical protein